MKNRKNVKKQRLIFIFALLCMVIGVVGCTSTPVSNIASKSVSNSTKTLDTPEIIAELEKAKILAGDDKSLLVTLAQQSKSIIDPPQVHVAFNSEKHATPTKLFDNLYYVGGTDVGSFIFTTTEGYIMIDSGYSYMPENYIIPDMQKLGLDPAKIKYILITHAGPDHVGGAKYFQKNYGTKIVMSKEEWDQVAMIKAKAKDSSTENDSMMKDMMEIQWPDQDIVGIDGQKLTLGDTTITIVHAPRKVNGGGLSYIAPVFDNGEAHMWATYGNTNVVGSLEDKKVYRASVEKFLTYTDAAKVDVIISNHPFVDGSISTMEELRNRKQGEPNPFVYGQERVRRFFELLDQCAIVLTARQEVGLDETGTKRLNQ